MKWLVLLLTSAVGTLIVSGMLIEARLHSAKYLAHLSAEAEVSKPEVNLSNPSNRQHNRIKQKARLFTVKVLTGKTWGSGILIDRQQNRYTVVTNRHVLVFARDNIYQVQAPDGKVYPATALQIKEFVGHDLALLQFKSNMEYDTAALAPIASSSLLVEQEPVFSTGFPIEIEEQKGAPGFYFNTGHIARFSSLDFGGGYQIGYTNSVKKGMSGGALLNRQGEVVGINGMHKYPIWGNPYDFSDGSLATETQQQEMSKFSWAIPINTFLDLAPQFAAD